MMSVSENIDTRTAAGRLVLNVLGSVSQWEREVIGERTSEALQHKVQQGEYTGGRVPLGYRLASCGVQLVEHPEEQAAISMARDLRRQGFSLRIISRELHCHGYLSRTGKVFDVKSISRIVAGIEKEEAA